MTPTRHDHVEDSREILWESVDDAWCRCLDDDQFQHLILPVSHTAGHGSFADVLPVRDAFLIAIRSSSRNDVSRHQGVHVDCASVV